MVVEKDEEDDQKEGGLKFDFGGGGYGDENEAEAEVSKIKNEKLREMMESM